MKSNYTVELERVKMMKFQTAQLIVELIKQQFGFEIISLHYTDELYKINIQYTGIKNNNKIFNPIYKEYQYVDLTDFQQDNKIIIFNKDTEKYEFYLEKNSESEVLFYEFVFDLYDYFLKQL